VAGARSDLILRPLEPRDLPELTRIIETPEVARWWDDGPPWEETDATMLTIESGGQVAGLIQYGEEPDAKYRHASIDIFLDPALHGRGLGTHAIRLLVTHLIEDRGHHRITIDPAVDNAPAIRAYEKAGFRPVGVMRAYERDMTTGEWHDGLLMELVGTPPPGDDVPTAATGSV
jgi:aminoglycoside 6'-N-acetyltransferase